MAAVGFEDSDGQAIWNGQRNICRRAPSGALAYGGKFCPTTSTQRPKLGATLKNEYTGEFLAELARPIPYAGLPSLYKLVSLPNIRTIFREGD